MQGYDLDDTLARTDFAQASHTPLAELFANAPVLYTPTTDFIVITGRPSTTPERRATSAWLRQHQPHCKGIEYVQAGDAPTTAQRKAAVINQRRLTDYTDNNRNVLAAMVGLVRAHLWLITDGKRAPYVDKASLAADWARSYLDRPPGQTATKSGEPFIARE